MHLALSTHWNGGRHRNGEAVIEEILELGFDRVELGYDLTMDLVAGVRSRILDGSVGVDSVHAYCPVPVGAPAGHPELYSLAARDSRLRALAVRHMEDTVRFAAEAGARVVVAHAGRVAMRSAADKLGRWLAEGKENESCYEKLKLKTMMRRDRKRGRHLDALHASLDELMPTLEESRVTLALENLPEWETMPTEVEALDILDRYVDGPIRLWHDVGHARIREAFGFACAEQWRKRTASGIVGVHLHESDGVRDVHRFPLREETVVSALKSLRPFDTFFVFEPAPGTEPAALRESLALFRRLFAEQARSEDHGTGVGVV